MTINELRKAKRAELIAYLESWGFAKLRLRTHVLKQTITTT